MSAPWLWRKTDGVEGGVVYRGSGDPMYWLQTEDEAQFLAEHLTANEAAGDLAWTAVAHAMAWIAGALGADGREAESDQTFRKLIAAKEALEGWLAPDA